MFSFLSGFSEPAMAAGVFELSPNVKKAYRLTTDLKLSEARLLLGQVKREEPDNLMAYHIENYIDFFTIFIDEHKREFQSLVHNKDRRLELIEDGDQDSPYYLYTQAEIKLQWALSRMKFEEYFTALMEVRSAYKMLQRNKKRFPDFVANNKSLGVIHALVGTLPDNYQWGVKLLGGVEGSVKKGKEEIRSVLEYAKTHDFLFEDETRAMYAWLLLHLENEDLAAWKILQSSDLANRKSPLSVFVLANVAMHTGRNDEAIQLLKNRPKGQGYFDFPYLDYMLGLAKLYRLDNDADQYFNAFLNRFHGQNYIKEAYQKMAWLRLINGDLPGYKIQIAKSKTKGFAVIGGDAQALKEAETGLQPNGDLLKARLLFDGGYYEKAYQLLKGLEGQDWKEQRFALEYPYRLGRVADAAGKQEEAIRYYQRTIDESKEATYYYACNAALQLGAIYEKQGAIEKAKTAYRQCLEMRPSSYRNSLHQKAKAWLNRLED